MGESADTRISDLKSFLQCWDEYGGWQRVTRDIDGGACITKTLDHDPYCKELGGTHQFSTLWIYAVRMQWGSPASGSHDLP